MLGERALATKGQRPQEGRRRGGLRSCHCPFLSTPLHTCAFQPGWPLGQGLAWVLPFHCPGSSVFFPTHTLAHAS